MHYEVFLQSSVREHYLADGDTRRAAVEGTGSTARISTSAALIMISVLRVRPQLGRHHETLFVVGLGVAAFLDVTLVRMVLVTAAMSLLGQRAWWLPNWLDNMLPRIGLEGSHPADPARPVGDRGEGEDASETDDRTRALT